MIAGVLALALFALPGCGRSAAEKPAVAATVAEPPATVGKARSELNIGYSLLHQQAVGIPKLNWILMFKSKRKNVERLTTSLLDYYQRLALSLEDVAGKYPAVRIDAESMPVLLAETRKAIGMDMAKDIAPLIGESGSRFERELLLMFYNALDEQRHLVGVMIEREAEPGLRQFLQTTQAQLEERRLGVGQLLDRQYFRSAHKVGDAHPQASGPRSASGSVKTPHLLPDIASPPPTPPTPVERLGPRGPRGPLIHAGLVGGRRADRAASRLPTHPC